ncbi:Ig-like domain-containing protein, partial [uncultured Methanobrevibacter sp.]|uniref:Ig-like domain-containing protein n=1 Tax=uncultured Methanobrevibacter sp. TaxID=253161 RepID=UPI0025CE5709
LTANKVGEADITVSFAANGKYRANSIKVHIKVVNVKVDIEIENIYLSLRIDDVLNINATLNPDVGTLKYVSSNSNVVSVDGSGQIKALKVGNAKLTVSYEGKGKYASSSKDVIVSVSKIPTQIEINNNLTMEIGENFNIKPILKPSASGNLKYSSSNGNIVGVDNGFVTTIGSGKAKITISYAGNEKYLPCEATVDVTVTARPTSIKVNDSITIGFGESMELGAILKTKYFDLDGTLLYESSNPSIVTVNGNGLINAIRKGNALITIKYNGARTSSGILVNQPCNATVKIFVTTQTTKITVNSEKLSLNVDDSSKIIAALDRPKNGVLKYSSNNKSVATVDATGNVRAVGEGVAIITILYPGNEDYRSSSANVAVSVSRHPSNIKSNLSYYIKVDDNIDLGAVTYPNNGVLTYSSSNPDIVTVDAKGRVTGLKSGSAIISIKFAGDKKYLAKEKKVTVLVSRIATSINVKPIQMYVGEEFAIKDALTPAGIGKLTYDGYDWEMIDVDSKGTVTALMEGTTEILISYGGNYKYAPSNGTVSVTVKKLVVPPEDYKFDIVVRDEYNKATFSLTLPDYLEGTFSITVDGVDNYAEPIVNGIAKCIVDDLSAGQHSVTMRYSGDELYSSFAQNANFYVSEIKIDKNRDISILYTASGRYTVHLTKDTKAMSGKNVIFKLNGKKIIAKTNKNGYASIKVKLPYRAKAYIVSAQFGKVKVSNKISIKSIVVAKNVAIKKSSKYATIKVSLKKVNKKYLINKKLILKFNGKKIIAKTNKKGVATFKIKKNIYYKLKVGKKYNYQVTYLKNTVTKKVTIKR